MGKDGVLLNHETIDLRYVEQLCDSEQLACLGHVVKYMEESLLDGKKTVRQLVEQISSDDTDPLIPFQHIELVHILIRLDRLPDPFRHMAVAKLLPFLGKFRALTQDWHEIARI